MPMSPQHFTREFVGKAIKTLFAGCPMPLPAQAEVQLFGDELAKTLDASLINLLAASMLSMTLETLTVTKLQPGIQDKTIAFVSKRWASQVATLLISSNRLMDGVTTATYATENRKRRHNVTKNSSNPN